MSYRPVSHPNFCLSATLTHLHLLKGTAGLATFTTLSLVFSAMLGSSFDYPDADLVLRSCAPDAVDFYVHRCILSTASPFFREMFTLPQPPADDGKPIPTPILDVSESADALDKLLRFVYPVADPPIATLDELVLVLGAACKYDMLVVVESLRRHLVEPRFITEAPLRVYAIATRYDLDEEAKIASKYTLTMNILDCPLSEDLKYITAYSYHRLLNLHRHRAKAAQELLKIPDDVKCMMCNGTHYGPFLAPRWWQDFSERASKELSMRPTSDVVFSMSFLAHSAKAGCERCAGSILSAHWFLEDLKKQIDALPATI